MLGIDAVRACAPQEHRPEILGQCRPRHECASCWITMNYSRT